MSHMAKIFIAFASLFFAFSSQASGLTEQAVKQVIGRMDDAAKSLNVQAVAGVLADNARITVHMGAMGGGQVMNLSKQQYIVALQQGWSLYANYRYSRGDTAINLQGEKAVVSYRAKEFMTVQGQSISATSKQEVTIELVRGKPLVTRLVAHADM